MVSSQLLTIRRSMSALGSRRTLISFREISAMANSRHSHLRLAVRCHVCSLWKAFGSWDLASDVHIFCSLVGLDTPCVSGLVVGRSNGTQPRYPSQRIGACSSNGRDFSVCFPFPGCRRTFDRSNGFGVAWLSGILDPVSTVTHVTTNGLVVAMISGIMLLAFFTMLTVSVVDL